MPHSIVYNAKTRIIEIKAWDRINAKEVFELISDVGRAIKENNCFLNLVDYRAATLDLSTLEIFELPQKELEFFECLKLPKYKIKRALTVSKDLKDFHFLEVVMNNNGLQFRIFENIDKATMWLLEEKVTV